jgi:hypothetical protein
MALTEDGGLHPSHYVTKNDEEPNSFTYMRSELDLVCRIAVQRANMRCRGKTRSERVRSEALIPHEVRQFNTVGYNPQ